MKLLAEALTPQEKTFLPLSRLSSPLVTAYTGFSVGGVSVAILEY